MLKEICFEGVLQSISNATLQKFMAQQVHLVSLNPASCENVDDDTIILMMKRFEQLRWLDISSCLRIRRHGMLAIFQTCSKLQSLYIDLGSTSGKHLRQNDYLKDEDIISLTKTCPDLRKLGILQCRGILTSDIIYHVLTSLRHLDDLSVTFASRGSKSLLSLDSDNRLQLVELNISDYQDIDDHFMGLISQNIVSVQILNLAYNCSLTTLSMCHAALRELHELHMEGVDFFECAELIQICAADKARLERLNLGHCSWLKDDALLEIASLLGNLVEVKLDYCNFIVRHSTIAQALQCPHLLYLNLKHVTMTDEDLETILQRCANLRSIKIGANMLVGARSLRSIAIHAPDIEELGVDRLDLSPFALLDLIATCIKIRKLYIHVNPHLRAYHLSVILFRLLNLEFITLTGNILTEAPHLATFAIWHNSVASLSTRGIVQARRFLFREPKPNETFFDWVQAGIDQGMSQHERDNCRNAS